MSQHYTRRDFLGFLSAGAAATVAPKSWSSSTVSKVSRPNIIHILIDDMGFADLGCYGNDFCETPNIDRLAAQGLRFTSGYAAAPICSASRAAFLTGKTPARLGFEFVTKDMDEDILKGWNKRFSGKAVIPPPYTINLPLKEQTIAERLKEAGYATGITGKWHVAGHHDHYLGWSPTYGPKQQGFDWGREEFGSHPYGYAESDKNKFGTYEYGQFPEDALTSNAIEFIKGHKEEPFFLFVSHYYVHVPLGTKCKWLLEKYEAKAAGKYSKKQIQYGAFVETLDHYVGQLLDALKESGLADNTLVALTSDNGGHPEFAFNAPLRGSKWNLYEGGIRVPMVVRWPNAVKAGTTCNVPVFSPDFMPTFCELADVTSDPTTPLDGASIVHLLKGVTPDKLTNRSLCWHFPYYHPEKNFDSCPEKIGIEDGYISQTRPQAAIRKGTFKLIYFFEDGRRELYNLENDIGEQKNLVDELPEKTTTMTKTLLEYLQSVNARFPEKKQVTEK